MNRIITLTTDFGLHDAYVAIMKGVILGVSPTVRLIDITHNVSPQDVMEAAFILRNSFHYFPAGSIHLAVVDPGVGSDRRAVALRKNDHWFVGPDNGLFSLLLDGADPDEAVVLDNPDIWLSKQPSATFHGRDIFSPAAGHLARGASLSDLGSPIDALSPLYWAYPIADKQGIQGWVVHVDRFGNCITNITRAQIDQERHNKPAKCYVGTTILGKIEKTYSEVASGEPLMLFDSNDLLEIAVNSGNASTLLNIRKGSPVNLVFLDDK